MNSLMKITTNDFNKKLMEMLCEDKEDDDKYCLISNVELEKDYVELICGHKFNYSSIYNEVYNQKHKTTHLETQRLSKNQIKCPYCRRVQNGLLISREGYDNVKYVNWPISLQYKPYKCAYIFLSGKRKNQKCEKQCSSKYCKNHEKIISKRLEKQKVKLEKKNAKLKKKKEILEKNIKQKVGDTIGENLIIDLTGDVEVYDFTGGVEPKPVCITCQYQFKKGKNKGKCCPVKKITKGYCKKHIKYSS